MSFQAIRRRAADRVGRQASGRVGTKRIARSCTSDPAETPTTDRPPQYSAITFCRSESRACILMEVGAAGGHPAGAEPSVPDLPLSLWHIRKPLHSLEWRGSVKVAGVGLAKILGCMTPSEVAHASRAIRAAGLLTSHRHRRPSSSWSSPSSSPCRRRLSSSPSWSSPPPFESQSPGSARSMVGP